MRGEAKSSTSASARVWLLLGVFTLACGEQRSASVELPPLPALDSSVAELAGASANPQDPAANGRAGMYLQAHGQLETAETLYRRAVALEPGALRWNYYLGVVLAERGDSEGAVAAFEEAADIDPEFAPGQRRLAALLVGRNEAERAEGIYRRLLERNPRDAEAFYGLGRISGEIESLRRAVELSPNYGAAHYELALAYRDAGDAEASATHMERYERNQNGVPAADDPLMAAVEAMKGGFSAQLNRAIELEARGDLPGAIGALNEALAEDPELVRAHANLVILYGRTGQPQKAREHYRLGVAVDPNDASLHYNFGVLAFRERRVDEAREAFEKAIESNPNHAQALNNLAQLKEAQGRAGEAMNLYRRALEARPDYRLARFHLGRLLLAGRPAEAKAEFARVIETRDEMAPEAMFGLAAAHAQLGEAAEAKRVLEDARRLALQFDQGDLAAKIAQEAAKLP